MVQEGHKKVQVSKYCWEKSGLNLQLIKLPGHKQVLEAQTNVRGGGGNKWEQDGHNS